MLPMITVDAFGGFCRNNTKDLKGYKSLEMEKSLTTIKRRKKKPFCSILYVRLNCSAVTLLL